MEQLKEEELRSDNWIGKELRKEEKERKKSTKSMKQSQVEMSNT